MLMTITYTGLPCKEVIYFYYFAYLASYLSLFFKLFEMVLNMFSFILGQVKKNIFIQMFEQEEIIYMYTEDIQSYNIKNRDIYWRR